MLERYDHLSGAPVENGENTQHYDRDDAAQVLRQMSDTAHQKTLLPRGSGQAPFAPQSYFYDASRTGAVPSWAIDKIFS